MISVEEAQARILKNVSKLPIVYMGLVNATNLVLARKIVSGVTVPPLDNSAMDGFAVKSDDIALASSSRPVTLKVTGEIPAGSVWPNKLNHGHALRIMTGAPIPQGADCVVPFEDTDEKSRRYSSGNVAQISITLPLARDTNIRRAGEDIQSGSTILECGRSLREADIGILASVGISRVPVYRPPRVAIIATGDELTDPGHPLKPGKIYNSNSYSLAALVRSCGAVPVVLGIAGDNVSSLNKSIKRALNYDIVLSTGGVSLGDYDLVKDVLARTGRIDFWTVRMKPGKPLAFGVLSDSRGNLIPHIGLPGNPVSVMVTFELFVRPAIYSMMGRRRISTMTVKATLESEVRNRDGRRVYVRVILSRRRQCVYAKPTGDQGSGILTSMSRADGLAVIPETIKQAQKGDVVDVILLNKEFRIT